MRRPVMVGIVILISIVFSIAALTSAKTEKSEIAVNGMTCEGCETAITSALQKVDGVKTASVSHKNGLAVIEYDAKKTDLPKLQAAIVKAGYSVENPNAHKTNNMTMQSCPSVGQCPGMSGSGGCCSPSAK